MKRKRTTKTTTDWALKLQKIRLGGPTNQFYYRFKDCCGEKGNTTPCEKHGGTGPCIRNMGRWTNEERNLFYEQFSKVGLTKGWGIFSKAIPTRVGYTCNQFFNKITSSCIKIQRRCRGYLVRKTNPLKLQIRVCEKLQPVPPPLPVPRLETISNEIEENRVSKGWVYCLSNKYYWEEKRILGQPTTKYIPLLKIGFTDDDPKERAKQLARTTGVPGPYRLEFAKCVRASTRDKRVEKETTLHEILDKYRVNGRREFFNIPKETLKGYFKLLADDEWYEDAVWSGNS